MGSECSHLVPNRVMRAAGKSWVLVLRERVEVAMAPHALHHPQLGSHTGSVMLCSGSKNLIHLSLNTDRCPLNSPRSGLCGPNQLCGLGQVPPYGICTP